MSECEPIRPGESVTEFTLRRLQHDWEAPLREHISHLEAELKEDEGVINVWRRRTYDAEADCKRYREALERIINCTDLQMGDGDGARAIASGALREASDWSERDTPPNPTLFKEV